MDARRTPRVLLRPEEAAVAMGISRAKLYRLIATGDLRAVRVGKALRVPVAAIEELATGENEVSTRQDGDAS